MNSEKVKGWLGVALIVWPLVRAIALAFGVHLPDVNLPVGVGEAAIASQAAGVILAARSPALLGPNNNA